MAEPFEIPPELLELGDLDLDLPLAVPFTIPFELLDLDDLDDVPLPPNYEGIRPQIGPQRLFANSRADICIFGGSAGGGKTWSLLLEPMRYASDKPGFFTVFFRRTTPQITNPGGLLDASLRLYPLVGGTYYTQPHEWRWPNGGKIKLAHLQHEQNVYDWQGTEIALLCFDELVHFTSQQFWYMVSRNRSTCGVRPLIRATCNPDADSWVAELIAWWIDQDTGLPIPERAGVVRYFVRVNDKMTWADRPEDLLQHMPRPDQMPAGTDMPRPKSLTFIPSSIYDNRELLKVNSDYLANLLALPIVERERLLGGNWKIRPAAGLYFQRQWCELVEAAPSDMDVVRYWDLAATEKTDGNDPDWSVGVKLGRCRDSGQLFLLDVIRERLGPYGVERLMRMTASHDGKKCRIGWGKDPGQAGKAQTQYLARALEGYTVMPESETGDKVTRFGPASSQCRAGNVKALRGRWNDEFFRTLEGFPDLPHDDDVDAFSGAFEMLNSQGPGWAIYEVYRRRAEKLARDKAGVEANAVDAAGPTIPWAKGSVEYERAIAEQRAADEVMRRAQEAAEAEAAKKAAAAIKDVPAGNIPAGNTPAGEIAALPANPPVDKPAGNSGPVAQPDAQPKVGSVEWMMQLNRRR